MFEWIRVIYLFIAAFVSVTLKWIWVGLVDVYKSSIWRKSLNFIKSNWDKTIHEETWTELGDFEVHAPKEEVAKHLPHIRFQEAMHSWLVFVSIFNLSNYHKSTRLPPNSSIDDIVSFEQSMFASHQTVSGFFEWIKYVFSDDGDGDHSKWMIFMMNSAFRSLTQNNMNVFGSDLSDYLDSTKFLKRKLSTKEKSQLIEILRSIDKEKGFLSKGPPKYKEQWKNQYIKDLISAREKRLNDVCLNLAC